jgi:hypothetical protein
VHSSARTDEPERQATAEENQASRAITKHADLESSVPGSFMGTEATLVARSCQEDEDPSDFNAKTKRRWPNLSTHEQASAPDFRGRETKEKVAQAVETGWTREPKQSGGGLQSE